MISSNTSKDFKKLIPQLTHDEYAGLEADIIANGCRDAPVEIREKAASGEISINQAYEVLNMSESQQVEIVEHIAEGEHPKDTIKDVKQKPHVANNSGNNEWYTPSEYIEAAREVMGSIDLDPASCEFANRNVKANEFFTTDNDGLSHEWYGNVWLNPPYAARLVDRFADKIAMREYKQAVILVNNATETAWFNTIIQVASAVVFPKARIRYLSVDGKKSTPLQGQAFIYVGDNTERFIDIFSRFGWSAKL